MVSGHFASVLFSNMSSQSDPVPALKRELADVLARAIDGWGTPEIVHMLHVPRSTVSKLRARRVERFSLESLIRYLERMNVRVTLRAEPVRPAMRVNAMRARGAGAG